MSRPGSQTLLPGFLKVGALGFLLDASVFQLLVSVDFGLIVARLSSAALSITCTWYLNRHFVFLTGRNGDSISEYSRYLGVQTAGLAVNFGVYFALISTFASMRQVPIIALCSGAIAALTLNFLGARFYAFRCSENQ